jgi:antitoxin (DNA-binding transcriptional repressor) of toxin-antitoxin stability system
MANVTATLENTQSDLARLVGLAQRGEEIMITSGGRVVARLTGVPPVQPSPERKAWLARLARLRESTATGKTSPTTAEILDDIRAERGC